MTSPEDEINPVRVVSGAIGKRHDLFVLFGHPLALRQRQRRHRLKELMK
jgi:hypothetical protein